MFQFFKKKAKELPEFTFLKNHPIRNKYFTRTLQWDWLNDEMIHVFDNKAPRVITMDPWPQRIYLDADGHKTVEEYIIWMANQYGRKQIPANLDKDIIRMMNDLVNDGELVRFSDNKIILAYYLDEPKSKQDIDKAYELMKQDGYLKEK